MLESYIVIDCETTGLIPGTHQILSIGAIDSVTGDEFYGECRIYDWNKIDHNALEINGFTEEQCRDEAKDTPLELYYKFRKWSEGRPTVLAGQNIGSFDVLFLKYLEERSHVRSWPFGFNFLDLFSVAFAQFKEPLGLDKICDRLDVAREPSPHNALEGARVEMMCFRKLLADKKTEIPTLFSKFKNMFR